MSKWAAFKEYEKDNLPSALGKAFAGASDNHLNIAHNAYSSDQDTDIEADHLIMEGPSPADLAGLIRRIDFLIENRQSIEAISLALHILQKYDVSDEIQSALTCRVEDSLSVAVFDGKMDEIRTRNLQILGQVNLSSEWVDALLNVESTGFAHIARGLAGNNGGGIKAETLRPALEMYPGLIMAA